MTIQCMPIIREFSSCGPCIPVGNMIRETKGGYRYIARDGSERWLGKRNGLVHIEPCPSCRDHAKTQFPNGYMD